MDREDRSSGQGPFDQGNRVLGPSRRGLKLQEQAGKPNARLNSNEARKRADSLQTRLQKRLEARDLKHSCRLFRRWFWEDCWLFPMGFWQR